jgi:hypothetical protein
MRRLSIQDRLMPEAATLRSSLFRVITSSHMRGWLLNAFLRASIVFFMLDSVINSSDERYAGKGLSIRNVVIVLVWTMVFRRST